MKVLITGGHLSPAASLIEAAPKDWQIYFVGRKSSFEGENTDSLEYKTVEDLEIPFFTLPSSRLQRKFTRYTLPSLAKIPYSVLKSINILRRVKPDVVVGFGGYISLPVCLAARFLKIPVVIHEQTLEAGAANKTISKWAQKICISWESSADFFPKDKVILTGNLLRKDILNFKNHPKTDKKLIFITGGSSGAHFINNLVRESLPELLKKYHVIHQVGDSSKTNDFEILTKVKKELSSDLEEKYLIFKHILLSEMGKIMQLSNLVIGRSGVNTISELLYLEKPALLIPIPFAQRNEQFKNAQFLKDSGLAEVLTQDTITVNQFVGMVDYMMENIQKYKIAEGKEDLLEKDSTDKFIKVINDVGKRTE